MAAPHPSTHLKSQKKSRKNQTPEANFQVALNSLSKTRDLPGAIALYEGAAASRGVRLNQHHFNALLYICSNAVAEASLKESALDHGFRIHAHMESCGVAPSEATVTAVARLAAARGDGDYAFGLVRKMGERGIAPRLRTYDPALYCFCGALEADKAYEVEEHMRSAGLSLEEPELSALLRVSAETGREERVYEYLHKLRDCVRWVSEETAVSIESWFSGEKAVGVGDANYDRSRVKDVVLRNGGGFHGLGWIGKGNWVVRRGNVDENGVCSCCGERLACVDIDDMETESFASSIAALAFERESKANFSDFQDWLEKHADYEAIVDGANIGLYQQNFADGGFSVPQLDAVVKELYGRSKGKWPLVILHNKRLKGLLESSPHKQLLQEWIDKGVLYTTPSGSNDDWYWLYAAVRLRCLLLTNDEMRDHIFELLGSKFFSKWKERHQVRYTFVKGSPVLIMPLPFSPVIQESETGSWHVPVKDDSNEEIVRTWVCITRPSVCKSSNGVLASKESPEGSNNFLNNHKLLNSSKPGTTTEDSNALGSIGFSQDCVNNTNIMTRKRKERSSSPPPLASSS
ncbi:proteinaceous RNase P 2 isoform X2 [Eucalyptus grandis]|uniref:proteinaceous RNase P 2 isoform X2 n=1 Tax=Eucalyptus grandis TaxID=71139 RepID=UPI00192E8860|nr:proteinaceous RNase P 2 isoform X2 [Eucalyptus grandis]